ncbi:PQQ-dependent sugar dehydrogenase [Shewanella sp.]|uniref:PQQ-dependent sugar dehydrogenase n=1 Tax=Shewanella sp. TaxID=50422 RepID=UPI0025882B68|nr:PQQ-dependent sugar dehydrogenase [Shewanella sp.]MCJ8305131.1 PQQ-dependent sugar dehydrogenase [Shewanella sp.]NQY27664.1 PQQ-dependent sugar dehydrogenase [Piscirickettsiaceae bacterium]
MSLVKYILYIAVVSTFFVSNYTTAQNHKTTLEIETIASNLGIPWGMALLPDKTLLVAQREGILSQIDLVTRTTTIITGLPKIKVKGQGGLFDVALSPDYKTDGWIYFSYSKNIIGQSATTLSRAKLLENELQYWQDLIITQSTSNTYVHFGGRIAFDDHNHVFLTIGDRGVRSNAQNRSNHAGSILRLNLDGSIPTDNPFINNPKILSEIWSYGHRNPQGLFFNNNTQKLWAIEHGPRGGDEINIIKAGHNYGWPIITYGREYTTNFPVGLATHRDDIVHPIKIYIPSIAPSSLIQYSGNAFPNWKNNLLIGSLKLRHLNRIILKTDNVAIDEIRLLKQINGRIRNVIEDANGWLYLSTDDGRILRVKPRD